jgi:hypothetical protein
VVLVVPVVQWLLEIQEFLVDPCLLVDHQYLLGLAHQWHQQVLLGPILPLALVVPVVLKVLLLL